MEEKEEIVSSEAIQQNSEVFEFHIVSYKDKELQGPAFELYKRSTFKVISILFILLCVPIMIWYLLIIISNLILGTLKVGYILLFCILAIVVKPTRKADIHFFRIYLRKATLNLSIKIYNDSILLSSIDRYEIVNLKDIKIKEKENGILLIFKKVNNHKTSKKLNFIKKFYLPYDCVPFLKSNFSENEIEQIKSLINQNSTKA